MFQHLVVPIDGSAVSWEAVPIATRMAAAVDGKVDVICVVDRLADVAAARETLAHGVADLGDLPVQPMEHVLATDDIAPAIARHVESITGAMVVMSSHGHGRSAAVLGSVTDELLRLTYGPVVVVGPHVTDDSGRLDGPYVVPVDGSHRADAIVPIVGAWAVEFGGVPWIVESIDPGIVVSADVSESAHVAALARDLKAKIGHPVEFESLHGERPSRAIVEFACGIGASLLFLTTHGRTGIDRLRLGSVAAEVVRHSPCPVVLHRPPLLPEP